MRAADKAFRGELRDLVKAHNKTIHQLTNQIAGLKLRAEIDQRSMKLISRAVVSGGAI
jgi:hypothetical protein